MKTINYRFNDSVMQLLHNLIGKSFHTFSCDRLPNASTTVYGAVVISIDNTTYALTNFLEPVDYINRKEDVGIFRFSAIDESRRIEIFSECTPVTTPVEQKIVSIKIVDETQYLYKDDIIEYEISTVRGVVFVLEDGREISFEKDIWFSEFIEVRTGYELETTFASTDVFIEEWSDSDYVPDIVRNTVVIK
ncbi:MAG: hypothetical protein LUH82_01750 [Clostridiales bacterium]|nr:hypothetical protein [Clostridiales bacterium]